MVPFRRRLGAPRSMLHVSSPCLGKQHLDNAEQVDFSMIIVALAERRNVSDDPPI